MTIAAHRYQPYYKVFGQVRRYRGPEPARFDQVVGFQLRLEHDASILDHLEDTALLQSIEAALKPCGGLPSFNCNIHALVSLDPANTGSTSSYAPKVAQFLRDAGVLRVGRQALVQCFPSGLVNHNPTRGTEVYVQRFDRVASLIKATADKIQESALGNLELIG